MTYRFSVIFIQTCNEWVSCLSIEIICILTKSSKFLKVIPFLRSTSISIYPLLLLFIDLSIVNSQLVGHWILIIWIQTWYQWMSCLSIKVSIWFTKSSKFLKVIPFFRPTSITIDPPLLLSFNLSIVNSHFMSYRVLIIWI